MTLLKVLSVILTAVTSAQYPSHLGTEVQASIPLNLILLVKFFLFFSILKIFFKRFL